MIIKNALRAVIMAGAVLLLSGCTNKVSITTLTGPSQTQCGGFNWKVAFDLDEPSPKGGYIVQEVDVNLDRKNCDGTPHVSNYKTHFFEAWKVNPGQDVSIYREVNPLDYDDKYQSPDLPNTKGAIIVNSKLKFFEDATLPPDMIPNNKPATPAGILPSSTGTPPFWDPSEAANHNLSISWNCCDLPYHSEFMREPLSSAVGSPRPSADGEETNRFTRAGIVLTQIESIPAWTNQPYGRIETDKLSAAIRGVKEFSDSDIRTGIIGFMDIHRNDSNQEESWSKVYLLLRALFNVPASADGADAKTFGGWLGVPTLEEGYNLLWPLTVNERGRIAVTGQFAGYLGRPYDAVGELQFFSKQFGRR